MHRDSWFVVIDHPNGPMFVIGDDTARIWLANGFKLVQISATKNVTQASLEEWCPPISSDELRALAQKVVEARASRQNEDIEEWAEKLASDSVAIGEPEAKTVKPTRDGVARAFGWRDWNHVIKDSLRDGYTEAGGRGALAAAIGRTAREASDLIEHVERYGPADKKT